MSSSILTTLRFVFTGLLLGTRCSRCDTGICEEKKHLPANEASLPS
jgi:hypothetical protein